jgi:hypothetical protein
MPQNVQQHHPGMAVAEVFPSLISINDIMDWIPAVFVTFKALVLGTGMFFAIKWHYDREIKAGKAKREVLRMGARLAAVFVLSLLGVALVAFGLIRMLGM